MESAAFIGTIWPNNHLNVWIYVRSHSIKVYIIIMDLHSRPIESESGDIIKRVFHTHGIWLRFFCSCVIFHQLKYLSRKPTNGTLIRSTFVNAHAFSNILHVCVCVCE